VAGQQSDSVDLGTTPRSVDLARRLAEAIWHMLTREQTFAPAGATDPLGA
jgi:hypothetical protein